MVDFRKTTLLLGIGNDILGDDAVGLLAVRSLKEEFKESVSTTEAMMGGLKLMEVLEGYERVLILDAMMTKEIPAGTIAELNTEQFGKTVAVAPHFVSLPEAIQLADQIGIKFPKEIKILAMEISDPYRITEDLSIEVRNSLPDFIKQARIIIQQWIQTGASG